MWYRKKAVYKFSLYGEYLQRYRSLVDAAKEHGTTVSNIVNCCKRRQKSAAGYVWKYSLRNKAIKVIERIKAPCWDKRLDEYLRLSYPFHKNRKRSRRNYISYLNREADFTMYLRMREENPVKWVEMIQHIESRGMMSVSVAKIIRESGICRTTHYAIPPYVPCGCYDRGESLVYWAAQL